MAALKRLTDRGLDQYKQRVSITAKTTADGSENPHYAKAVRQLAAAQCHYDATRRIGDQAKVAGYRRNDYAGVCKATGVDVKEGAGFAKKEAGRWVVYSWDAVQNQLGLSVVDLPELES